MPLPPLETQKKLAAVLDQADALIASSRARLSLTDALTSAVFLDMFGDPVANPMGWPLKAFGEICPTRLGKMLDKKTQTGSSDLRGD